MSIDSQWATDYLDREAARVVVVDTLDDILDGATIVALSPARQEGRRSTLAIVAAAAAVVTVAAGGIAITSHRARPAQVPAAAVAPPPTAAPVETAPVETQPATTLPPEAYPEGGMVLGGQQPSCTMIDASSYACTLPAPFAGDVPDYDDTGFSELYTNTSGLVAGGCRSTAPDASTWTCYVGERAVEEQIIVQRLLGDYVGTEFIAG